MEEKFLDLLWELEKLLDTKSGDSLIEKYHWFATNSEHGRDCSYAKKCKLLFFQDEYSKVRSKILELNHLMARIEDKGVKID